MSRSNLVRFVAEEQLDKEDFEACVEQEKTRLRERRSRPLWQKLFPFKITIERV